MSRHASASSTTAASDIALPTKKRFLIRFALRGRLAMAAVACDDCLCASVCLPCVQAQLMRHLGLSAERYRLVSSDGVKDVGAEQM